MHAKLLARIWRPAALLAALTALTLSCGLPVPGNS